MTRATQLVGSKIPLGDLKIGKQLGVGGFGVVHEARISGINFPFAIKFLDPSPFNSDAAVARERFFKEAEILFKLRHPHIVAIYGVGEYGGRPYILMEQFAGMDLERSREKHGAPDPEKVLPFIEYIAGALGHAHSKGIVHRDIKPRNLMTIRGDGRVLDFGIATALDPDGTRLTRTGGTCVGDSYSAPELTENPRLRDPKCDVYSLGACWFWLLTGRSPKGLGWESALRGSVKISPDYERVLLRCLSQADSRYASMDELVLDIHALRIRDQPRASIDPVTDDDALILGMIASLCPSPTDSTSFYAIEHELKGSITPLVMRIAITRLLRREFIETFVNTHDYNSPTPVFRPTQTGDQWIEVHQRRIAVLLENTRPRQEPAGDDGSDGGNIPF